MEIEDTDSTGYSPGNADAALADLVDRLNDDAGSETRGPTCRCREELYAVERDVIRNGIIYQPAAVQPVGEPVGLVDESVWSNAREPIAQTFTGRAATTFTVVANHFKSKSPGEPTGDNVDTGDGQGAWNGDRVRQASSLAAFADRLVADTGDDDVLLHGRPQRLHPGGPDRGLRDGRASSTSASCSTPVATATSSTTSPGSLDHAMATRR